MPTKTYRLRPKRSLPTNRLDSKMASRRLTIAWQMWLRVLEELSDDESDSVAQSVESQHDDVEADRGQVEDEEA